jgi:hypothetical protein
MYASLRRKRSEFSNQFPTFKDSKRVVQANQWSCHVVQCSAVYSPHEIFTVEVFTDSLTMSCTRQVWKLLVIDLFGALAVEQACLLLFYKSACSTPTDYLLR